MRAVFGLVLLAGLALAGFAVYMVQGHLGEQETALARERAKANQMVTTTKIYAPNRTLKYGEEVTADDVVLIDYAVAYLPEGVLRSSEDLFPEGENKPRMVLRQMEKNEPILVSKVTGAGEMAGITSLLARGKRAFTIKVDVSSGVSGFLRPGDHVDIYWTGKANTGNSNQNVTQLIRTAVEIIAIDQSSDYNQSGAVVARTVTVQVSPQDVGALAQAQSTGKLYLALVGVGDDTVAGDVLVNQQSLLGLVEEAVVEAPEPEAEKVCTIRQRRGAEVLEIPIPCTN